MQLISSRSDVAKAILVVAMKFTDIFRLCIDIDSGMNQNVEELLALFLGS